MTDVEKDGDMSVKRLALKAKISALLFLKAID